MFVVRCMKRDVALLRQKAAEETLKAQQGHRYSVGRAEKYLEIAEKISILMEAIINGPKDSLALTLGDYLPDDNRIFTWYEYYGFGEGPVEPIWHQLIERVTDTHMFSWPGREKRVSTWFTLANGVRVGINESLWRDDNQVNYRFPILKPNSKRYKRNKKQPAFFSTMVEDRMDRDMRKFKWTRDEAVAHYLANPGTPLADQVAREMIS